ncbi:MAG: hypothetical protein ACYS8K_08085 [Planctomycetota bacterium]|jgi:hypothetical protein
MHYFVVFQVLCGCFAAFTAGRKGRRPAVWWFVGALVPVFGVVLSLAVPPLSAGPASSPLAAEKTPLARRPRAKPKRCCGSYIPDCFGCSYFRRPLFDPGRSEGKKGHCEFFDKDLITKSEDEGSKVVIEDG